MKPIQSMTLFALVLGLNVVEAEAERPRLALRKNQPAEEACVTEECVPSLVPEECAPFPAGEYCKPAPRRPLFTGKWIEKSKNWVADTCVDIVPQGHHTSTTECVPHYQPLPEATYLEDSCVLDSCVDGTEAACGLSEAERLARLIHVLQNSPAPKQRQLAAHRIGSHFDGCQYPQVMTALAGALNDCAVHVRIEASDELGDQLRKNGTCCSPEVAAALQAGLKDGDRRIRRQSAQALKMCGYEISGCTDLGCVDDGCADLNWLDEGAYPADSFLKPLPGGSADTSFEWKTPAAELESELLRGPLSAPPAKSGGIYTENSPELPLPGLLPEPSLLENPHSVPPVPKSSRNEYGFENGGNRF